MSIFKKLFGEKPVERQRSDQGQSTDLMRRASAFARQAHAGKASVSVRFLELPVFLATLAQSWGDFLEGTRSLDRVSFTCAECGPLDRRWILREYQPPYPPEKNLCPSCRGSDTVEMTYDPSIQARI